MTTHPDTAAGMEAAYRRYISRYPGAVKRALASDSPIDFAGLNAWSFPLLVVVGDGAQSIVRMFDEAQFDAMFRELYRGYQARGWDGRVTIDSVAVMPVAANLGLLEATGTRYLADGQVLDRWDTCYLMRREADDWRTFLITDGKAPRPGRDEWLAWLQGLDHLVGGR